LQKLKNQIVSPYSQNPALAPRKDKENFMNTRQLKALLEQIEGLKTSETSADFQAGVDAAKALVQTIAQESIDRDRMQKLEAELAELRTRYPVDGQPASKRRGRRPKAAQMPEEQGQAMESQEVLPKVNRKGSSCADRAFFSLPS
jgi:hypothetical protein